jgi:hypothetical protein
VADAKGASEPARISSGGESAAPLYSRCIFSEEALLQACVLEPSRGAQDGFARAAAATMALAAIKRHSLLVRIALVDVLGKAAVCSQTRRCAAGRIFGGPYRAGEA